VDPGHTGAHEIGYIIQGVIRIEFPGLGQSFRLEAGDFVFIPEREPHTLYNVGTETARMTWSTAPNLGRPAPGPQHPAAIVGAALSPCVPTNCRSGILSLPKVDSNSSPFDP
jgi:glyoxylate utilization-related uncharacterized protein